MRYFFCIVTFFIFSDSYCQQGVLVFDSTAFFKLQKDYHKNGNISCKGWVDTMGVKQGQWDYWSDNGKLIRTENYKNGLLNGINTYYHNDTLFSKTWYTKNQPDSLHLFENEKLIIRTFYFNEGKGDSTLRYDKNGEIMYINTQFSSDEGLNSFVRGCRYNNKFQLENCDTAWLDSGGEYENKLNAQQKNNEDIIEAVDTPAEFPGGVEAMNEFVRNNTSLPAPARAQKIYGKVSVSFIVESDGTLSNIEIVKSLGYGCDEELIHCIKKMPPWKPAMSNGKPVRTRWVIPVVFGDPPSNKKLKYEYGKNH